MQAQILPLVATKTTPPGHKRHAVIRDWGSGLARRELQGGGALGRHSLTGQRIETVHHEHQECTKLTSDRVLRANFVPLVVKIRLTHARGPRGKADHRLFEPRCFGRGDRGLEGPTEKRMCANVGGFPPAASRSSLLFVLRLRLPAAVACRPRRKRATATAIQRPIHYARVCRLLRAGRPAESILPDLPRRTSVRLTGPAYSPLLARKRPAPAESLLFGKNKLAVLGRDGRSAACLKAMAATRARRGGASAGPSVATLQFGASAQRGIYHPSRILPVGK
jgi:hypothetical protein